MGNLPKTTYSNEKPHNYYFLLAWSVRVYFGVKINFFPKQNTRYKDLNIFLWIVFSFRFNAIIHVGTLNGFETVTARQSKKEISKNIFMKNAS